MEDKIIFSTVLTFRFMIRLFMAHGIFCNCFDSVRTFLNRIKDKVREKRNLVLRSINNFSKHLNVFE